MKALRSQVIDTNDKYFSSIAIQMAMSHHSTAFSYDVLCIIGTYLSAYMKALATASVYDPGGQISTSFQYLSDKLSHGRYVGCPLPPSFQNFLATRASERAAEDRHPQDPVLGPTIVRQVAPCVGLGDGANVGGTPTGQL